MGHCGRGEGRRSVNRREGKGKKTPRGEKTPPPPQNMEKGRENIGTDRADRGGKKKKRQMKPFIERK